VGSRHHQPLPPCLLLQSPQPRASLTPGGSTSLGSPKKLSAGGQLLPLARQGSSSSAYGRGPSNTAASVSSVGSQVQMLRLQALRGEEVSCCTEHHQLWLWKHCLHDSALSRVSASEWAMCVQHPE
jgi:hypothetical protein